MSSDLQFTGKGTEAYKGKKSNLHVVDKQVIINQIFRDHRNLLMVIVMNSPKAVVTDAYLAGNRFWRNLELSMLVKCDIGTQPEECILIENSVLLPDYLHTTEHASPSDMKIRLKDIIL